MQDSDYIIISFEKNTKKVKNLVEIIKLKKISLLIFWKYIILVFDVLNVFLTSSDEILTNFMTYKDWILQVKDLCLILHSCV